MKDKLAITDSKLAEILAKRWSPRAFDKKRTVGREDILSVCEAGRWAPSCFGDEPWRFMVFDRNHNEEAYNRAMACLGEWNQGWAENAPVLLFGLSSEVFRKNGEANRWGQFDTGAASENIYLQAVSLGLMAHPMGGFDGDKIIRDFKVPDGFTPMVAIAIGYQAEPDILDDRYKKAETAERFRRPLGNTFFDSGWEKPIS